MRRKLTPEERAVSIARRREYNRLAAAKHYRRYRRAIRAARRGKKDTGAKHRVKRWRQRHAQELAAARHMARVPQRTRAALAAAGLHVVTASMHASPLLSYIDHTGHVHHEDTRSAEQVIADFLETGHTGPREHAPKKEGAPP